MANPVTTDLVLECLAGNITKLSDNDAITQWNDTSGLNNHLVSPAGGGAVFKAAVSPAGENGIYFDATGTPRMYVNSLVRIGAGTTFVVGRQLGANANAQSFFSARNISYNTRWWIRYTGGLSVTDVTYQVANESRIVADNRGWAVRALRGNGDSKTGFYNGDVVASWTDTYTYANSLRLGVGAYVIENNLTVNTGLGLDGHISAVLHYNRALTDQEVADVSGWLEGLYLDSPLSFSGEIADQTFYTNIAASVDVSPYFTGGAAPYSFSVTTGALPAGLSLSSSTGVISGTPTATASASVVITATDTASETAATNSFTVTVSNLYSTEFYDQIGTAMNPNSTTFQWAQIASREIGGTTYQACIYWAADEYMCIGTRILGGSWRIWKYNGTGPLHSLQLNQIFWDNHENCVCEIDADGYLHVAYNHHDDPLRYRRSTLPINAFEGVLTTQKSMLGTNENSVTYPFFLKRPDTGDLYFLFRNGVSGNGNTHLYVYDEATETWSSALGLTAGLLIDGQTEYSAYPVGAPRWDGDGNMWFVSSWRETSDATTAHDFIAFYHDGTGWKKPDGTAQTMPVTKENATVVLDTDVDAGYPRTTNDFDVAPDGRIVFVYEQIGATRDLRAVHRSAGNVWTVIDLGYEPPAFPGQGRVLYDPTGDTWEILIGDGVASESSAGIQTFKTGSGNLTFTQSAWKAGYWGPSTVAYDRTQWLADRAIYYAVNKVISGVDSSPYLVELNDSYANTDDASIPLAFSDTAPATLLTVQVWSKVPKKADVEGLY